VNARRVLTILAIITLVASALSRPTAGQRSDVLGPSTADVNCSNFLPAAEGGQEHAQAVFVAAGGLQGNDPYQLDLTGERGAACDGANLGSAPPATCQNFRAPEDAQALLAATAPNDPYGLDPDHDGVACDGGPITRPDPLASPPPSDPPATPQRGASSPKATATPTTTAAALPTVAAIAPTPAAGTRVITIAAPLGTGQTLDDQLNARFAALEAQFAAFAQRAQNGFGALPPSTGQTSGAGTGSTTPVVVSTGKAPSVSTGSSLATQQPAAVTRRQAVHTHTGGKHKHDKHKHDKHKHGKHAGKNGKGKHSHHEGKHHHHR
jgi:hypothetical protein